MKTPITIEITSQFPAPPAPPVPSFQIKLKKDSTVSVTYKGEVLEEFKGHYSLNETTLVMVISNPSNQTDPPPAHSATLYYGKIAETSEGTYLSGEARGTNLAQHPPILNGLWHAKVVEPT